MRKPVLENSVLLLEHQVRRHDAVRAPLRDAVVATGAFTAHQRERLDALSARKDVLERHRAHAGHPKVVRDRLELHHQRQHEGAVLQAVPANRRALRRALKLLSENVLRAHIVLAQPPLKLAAHRQHHRFRQLETVLAVDRRDARQPELLAVVNRFLANDGRLVQIQVVALLNAVVVVAPQHRRRAVVVAFDIRELAVNELAGDVVELVRRQVVVLHNVLAHIDLNHSWDVHIEQPVLAEARRRQFLLEQLAVHPVAAALPRAAGLSRLQQLFLGRRPVPPVRERRAVRRQLAQVAKGVGHAQHVGPFPHKLVVKAKDVVPRHNVRRHLAHHLGPPHQQVGLVVEPLDRRTVNRVARVEREQVLEARLGFAKALKDRANLNHAVAPNLGERRRQQLDQLGQQPGLTLLPGVRRHMCVRDVATLALNAPLAAVVDAVRVAQADPAPLLLEEVFLVVLRQPRAARQNPNRLHLVLVRPRVTWNMNVDRVAFVHVRRRGLVKHRLDLDRQRPKVGHRRGGEFVRRKDFGEVVKGKRVVVSAW